MRDRSPHRELRHLLFSNIKELLVLLPFEQAHKAHKAFFHSGVYCDICKMKQFSIKKLFVTKACLHILHYVYLVIERIRTARLGSRCSIMITGNVCHSVLILQVCTNSGQCACEDGFDPASACDKGLSSLDHTCNFLI